MTEEEDDEEYDDPKIVKSRMSGFSHGKLEAGRNGLGICTARVESKSCVRFHSLHPDALIIMPGDFSYYQVFHFNCVRISEVLLHCIYLCISSSSSSFFLLQLSPFLLPHDYLQQCTVEPPIRDPLR